MIKKIITFFCLFVLNVTLIFGSTPSTFIPQRQDKLDSNSPYARLLLQRAEQILSTLVHDPESYHLILSSRPSFGGEAVPPFVFSDKPTIILHQGALSLNRSSEEIAFMMAHELGHLNLHHMEQWNEKMQNVFDGHPIGISGAITFSIFYQKFQEREADMFGLGMYKKAGYSVDFFPYTLSLLKINPNIHYGSSKIFGSQLSSLSMRDSHFSMQERFELLTRLT